MKSAGKLMPGSAAPVFTVLDMGGSQIDLRNYLGRHVLLSFYRYASCPLCNLRVHDLARKQLDWHARGLDMLAVFQSPADKMMRYVGNQHAPFPLIPDPDEQLYLLYGVGHSWGGFLKAWATRLPEIGRSVVGKGFLPGSVENGIHRIPADFIIDPLGRIGVAYYGRDIGDHLPVERIERLLSESV